MILKASYLLIGVIPEFWEGWKGSVGGSVFLRRPCASPRGASGRSHGRLRGLFGQDTFANTRTGAYASGIPINGGTFRNHIGFLWRNGGGLLKALHYVGPRKRVLLGAATVFGVSSPMAPKILSIFCAPTTTTAAVLRAARCLYPPFFDFLRKFQGALKGAGRGRNPCFSDRIKAAAQFNSPQISHGDGSEGASPAGRTHAFYDRISDAAMFAFPGDTPLVGRRSGILFIFTESRR